MSTFSDRLAEAVRRKGPLCVGLDPRWESLPLEIRKRYDDGTLAAVARAYEEFCARVIDVVARWVPIVKPQSAFFEACGPAGMLAQQKVLARAKALGLVNEIFDDAGFDAQVSAYARRFVPPAKASKAVGAIKRAVISGLDLPLESGLALERELQQQLFVSEDAKEGIAAYVEKRPAEFKGR